MNYQNFCYLGDQFEFGYGQVLIDCRHFAKPDSHDEFIKHIIKVINSALAISNQQFNKNQFIVNVDLHKLKFKNIEKNLVMNLVKILNKLYPDKLNICYIRGASKFFLNIFKIVSMFIHKDTKAKIKFIKNNGIIENNLDYLESYKPKQLLLEDSKIYDYHKSI